MCGDVVCINTLRNNNNNRTLTRIVTLLQYEGSHAIAATHSYSYLLVQKSH
jgi:hypothetical protein